MTVYLFRKDAMEYYKIDEQQVFNKALACTSRPMKYDPANFELAQDVAQTYYGIKPVRTDEALSALDQCVENRRDRHRERRCLPPFRPDEAPCRTLC